MTCNGFDCNDLAASRSADFEYGTGKEFDANGKHCMLADMKRYMTDSQPDTCPRPSSRIANVGTYGSGDERSMQSRQQAALSDAAERRRRLRRGLPSRDDAILVLVFITDEEDDIADDGKGSPGEPASWYEAVVAAKSGDEKAAVVLGLVGDSNLPMGPCAADLDPDDDGMGGAGGPAPAELRRHVPRRRDRQRLRHRLHPVLPTGRRRHRHSPATSSSRQADRSRMV